MNKLAYKVYTDNIQKFNKKVLKLNKRLTLLSIARLLSFLLSFTFLLVFYEINILFAFSIFIVFFALFIYLIIYYNKTKSQNNHFQILKEINENEIEALKGNYSIFPEGKEFDDPDHNFSFDLDIFGEYSLFQYVNRTCTSIGKIQLAKWLLIPLFSEKEIYQRQHAVNELTNKLYWRQSFLATGKQYDIDKSNDEEEILNWLGEKPYFSKKIIYQSLRFILPLLVLGALLAAIFKAQPINIFFTLFILNLVFSNFEFKKINLANERISKRLDLIKKYGNLTRCIEKEPFNDEYLNTLKNLLWYKHINSSKVIKQLSRQLNALEGRNNLLAGVLLNGLFSWNVFYLIAIEKWKIKYKSEVKNWLNSIKHFDALICLANLAYNNPNFIFPVIKNNIIIKSKNIGHPLIIEENRVCNNFSIKKDNEFVIITGPNMAGKSTFLRTIGINLILAMAGAPVCADEFLFAPVNIFTSMRTSDSLSKNESYFLAELIRLKSIISYLENGNKALILLDEILKGTNIQDKQTGSKEIIKKLIDLKSPGIIATHDLSLIELKKTHAENIIEKSFEIEIKKEEIIYNYILKDGSSNKMNAMILMKQMGLMGTKNYI
ncbi:MAG: hypothetical protein JXB17_04130 [Bacteroidales bacterium]|nr:hypothetical protein [Bacteroidales bacterium]